MSPETGNCGVEGDPQARGNLLSLKPPLTRITLGLGLEKVMAPHSSTLAWKNPMDGVAWKTAIHGVAAGWT